MKKIIFISGTMGVGKTIVSTNLKKLLTPSVFLDGDWCWDMQPFVVNEENKAMVIKNIQFLLQSFIANSNFDSIIFCWVMDQQTIIDQILSKLSLEDSQFYSFTLLASEEQLRTNLTKDILKGLRTADVIERALQKQQNYEAVHSQKIATADKSPKEIAEEIFQKVKD